MKQPRTNIWYVQSAASQDIPPPYYFPDVSVHAFVFEANVKAVQEYCDRFLNLGSKQERGFEYRAVPYWPYATLLFLNYPVMISAKKSELSVEEPNEGLPHGGMAFGHSRYEVPYSDRGIMRQREVFVAMPVIRYGLGAKGLVTESELEWIIPWIVVNKPWSCVCGREMLGLGKLLAGIDIDQGFFPDSFEGQVRMPGWKDERQGEMQGHYKFMKVSTGPILPTFRTSHSPEKSIATLLANSPVRWGMENMTGLSNFIDYASLGVIPTAMRTIGLKQYRDAGRPDKAIYQALVSCRSKYSNVRDLQLYDEGDVTIEFNRMGSFSNAIDTILGQPEAGQLSHFPGMPESEPATGRKVSVKAGLRFHADINYDKMSIVHEFPINPEGGTNSRPTTGDLTARWFRPFKGFFGRRPLP